MKLIIVKFYRLFLLINLWISKNFFYSVCYFYRIVHIKAFNFIKSLKKDFSPIRGKIDSTLEKIENLDKEILINKKYKKYYYLKKMPSFLIDIVNYNKNEIIGYLGKNFVYENPGYYETFAVPDDFKHFDIYSNVWHLDSDTYKVLKVFVLTCDVSIKDGPLVYLDKFNTEKNWDLLSERGNNNAIKEFGEQEKFIGEKGNYLIIDTSRNLHRATPPSNMRSMISLSLYPSFVPSQDINRYEWKF